MRIAMVVSGFPVLSETFVLDQITGLIDLGHDVQVFSLGRPEGEKVHPDVARYDLLARTHYLNGSGHGGDTAVALRVLARTLARRPRLFSRLLSGAPRKLGLPQRGFIARWGTLVLEHLREPFDIIHCHFGPVGLGTLPVARVLSVPLITTFHGYDAGKWPREHGADAYPPLFAEGAAFAAVSEFIADQLRALGCPEEKIVVLPISSSIADIGFRERQGRQRGPIRILTIARLSEKKGLAYSIRAAAALRDRGCSLSYQIAGDGPLRQDLERLVHELELEDTVHLLGWQDRPAILQLLYEADLFVLSSVTASDGDHEGMPVVLREAQAAGLPTVTTEHAGNPEAIIDGESGFVVPERDVEALADRLAYLIDNPHLWPEFGRRGREFVEENFDMRKLNRRLVEIYEAVIEGRLPAHG